MHQIKRHVLIALDEPSRTGICLECGTTHLHRKGDRWRCGTGSILRMRKLRSSQK